MPETHDPAAAARELIAYYEASLPTERTRRRTDWACAFALAGLVGLFIVLGAMTHTWFAAFDFGSATLAALLFQRVVVRAVTRRRAWVQLTMAVLHADAFLSARESLRSGVRPDA